VTRAKSALVTVLSFKKGNLALNASMFASGCQRQFDNATAKVIEKTLAQEAVANL
jgi:hypothetical protein